ncbi:unnamed protein product [Pylaiella littoralis]
MARWTPSYVLAAVFSGIAAHAAVVSAFSNGLPGAAAPLRSPLSGAASASTSARISSVSTRPLQVRALSPCSSSSSSAAAAAVTSQQAGARRHHYCRLAAGGVETARGDSGHADGADAAGLRDEAWGVWGAARATRRRKRETGWGRGRGGTEKRGRERASWLLCSSSGVSSTVGGADLEGLGESEVVLAGADSSSESGSRSGGGSDGAPKKQDQSFLKTLWEFSRPHTMIGTAISIPAVGVFAGPAGVLPGRRFCLAMLWAMVPSLLINVYITGLNQITDVEIDKVNKPYLPIPAGNLTPRRAKATVSLCLLAGVALGLAPCSLGSPGLALTVVLSVLIGTCYSLPPFRLKVRLLGLGWVGVVVVGRGECIEAMGCRGKRYIQAQTGYARRRDRANGDGDKETETDAHRGREAGKESWREGHTGRERERRFPQIAALCILVVRGSVINGGFYSHGQLAGYGLSGEKTALWALTLPFRDAKCALALAYFTVFAIVIALMKDVPDVAGDRKFNIPSFSVVLGETKLFAFARRLLTTLLWSTAAALGVGAKAAADASLPWTAASRGFVAAAALVMGQEVRRRAVKTDPEKPDQVYAYYMDLWKIFYMSYLFLPLAR